MSKKDTRKHVALNPAIIQQIDALKGLLGVTNRTDVVSEALKICERLHDNNSAIPIAFYDFLIQKNGPPVVLSGIPGSGKSYTLDLLLKECKDRKQPFLLFSSRAKDSKSTEHTWIPNTLSYYEFPILKWLDSPGQYRVELETDLNLRRQEMKDAAQTLLRLEGDERLGKWVIAVEEAADYSDIKSFATFLRRMRKSTRRIVVVSTEAELFKMCQAARPIPSG